MSKMYKMIFVLLVFGLIWIGLPEKQANATTMKQYYVTMSVNPRTANSWESSVAMSVPRGYAVQVNMDNYMGPWYEITFRDTKGWIPLNYLSATRYFTDYVTNFGINIRQDRNWDTPVVISIPESTVVWVVNGSSVNGWAEVIYSGKTGYIPLSYLTDKKLFNQITSQKNVTYAGGIVLGKEDVYSGGPFNTIGSKKIGTSQTYLNKYFKVDREAVLNDGVTWLHLADKDNKEIGWIKKQAVKNITMSTYNQVQSFIEKYPEYQSYFEGIFDETKMDNDLDTLIVETISTLNQTEAENKKELEELNAEYEQLAVEAISPEEDQLPNEQGGIQARNLGTVAAARAAYLAGIAIVSNKGHQLTANYMFHAQVPYGIAGWLYKPSDIVHKNDSIAKSTRAYLPFFTTINQQFEKEMLTKGKVNATVKGKFEFEGPGKDRIDSGQLYTALQHVKYTATFKKKTNGTYKVQVVITDTYDFKWGKFENFGVQFGNNYCVLMTRYGLIKPFDIKIIHDVQ